MTIASGASLGGSRSRSSMSRLSSGRGLNGWRGNLGRCGRWWRRRGRRVVWLGWVALKTNVVEVQLVKVSNFSHKIYFSKLTPQSGFSPLYEPPR